MIPSRQVLQASPQVTPHHFALAKRFRDPDQLLAFENGRLEVVTVGGEVVAKGSFAPGWRWSRCTDAGSGTGSYSALVLSGQAGLKTDDGGTIELAGGDLFHASITPSSDMWVIGSRPCEVLYVRGVDALVRALRGKIA
jgi:hypothetical protein